MENELIIKEVDFNGTTLLAVQDINGNIFVGVSYICNGIGLTEKQKDHQVASMQEDVVLRKGCKKLPLKLEGQVRNALCIELEFLPIWLAKIPITPKMKKESEALKVQYGKDYTTTIDNLIEYQLKAKDVLAKAFIPNIESFIQNYLDMDEDERGIAYFKEKKERKLLELQAQELIPKARSFDQLIGANGSQNMNSVAKSFNVGRGRLFAFLREKDILMTGSKNDKEKHNVPRQQYLEQKLFVVREYTIPDADGEIVNRTQTLVTAKGIEFIDKLLKEIDYDLEKFSDSEQCENNNLDVGNSPLLH